MQRGQSVISERYSTGEIFIRNFPSSKPLNKSISPVLEAFCENRRNYTKRFQFPLFLKLFMKTGETKLYKKAFKNSIFMGLLAEIRQLEVRRIVDLAASDAVLPFPGVKNG